MLYDYIFFPDRVQEISNDSDLLKISMLCDILNWYRKMSLQNENNIAQIILCKWCLSLMLIYHYEAMKSNDLSLFCTVTLSFLTLFSTFCNNQVCFILQSILCMWCNFSQMISYDQLCFSRKKSHVQFNQLPWLSVCKGCYPC